MTLGRRLRLLLALTILIVSLALLVWGLLPSVREQRTRQLLPGEIQILTPASSLPAPPFSWRALL